MRKNIRQVISTVVISIFLITFGYLSLTYAANSDVNQTLYKVTKVIDGDTIEVEIGSKKEKVRLIGIDTPETKHPSKPVQCYGKEASDKAKQMMVGKEVRLEADPTNTNRDKYNRLLRYVYLEDGSFVNELLVQEGYAYAYLKFPFQYKKQFRGYQKEAKVSGKGLWSICEKKPVLKQEPTKTTEPIPTTLSDVDVYNFSGTGQKNLGTFTANAPWKLTLTWKNGIIEDPDPDLRFGIGVWFCSTDRTCYFTIPAFNTPSSDEFAAQPNERGTFEIELRPDSKTSWTARIEIPKTTSAPPSTSLPVIEQTPQTQPTSQQCFIKGNISSTGNKIYHVPNGAYYNKTTIDESAGEKWFCSEAEAIAAGWRKSSR